MKKILIFIIVTLIICIIFVVNSTLCKQFYRGQQDKQSIVHFMLYSEMGSMDEKEPRMNKIYADMYEGTWDTESGNVGVDLKNRIFRMQGSTYFNIVKMWDGNDNYFISTYLDNSIIEKHLKEMLICLMNKTKREWYMVMDIDFLLTSIKYVISIHRKKIRTSYFLVWSISSITMENRYQAVI